MMVSKGLAINVDIKAKKPILKGHDSRIFAADLLFQESRI